MKVNVKQWYAPEFKPVEITITIESLEELRSLTARADLAPGKLRMDNAHIYGDEDFCRVLELYDVLRPLYTEAKR